MARLTNGILGPILGKIENLVGYIRLGVPVIRMRPRKPKKKIKRSDGQKAVNLKFRIVKSFISIVSEFVNVGYRLDALGTTKIAENNATSYLLKEAIVGEYPDLALDFSKVRLCKGKLPPPVNATVELEGDFLKFKWDVNPNWNRFLKRDQVMLLAYSPVNEVAEYVLSGARRSEGADVLPVNIVREDSSWVKKDAYLETYMAFISDDRQGISDSIYVGKVMI